MRLATRETDQPRRSLQGPPHGPSGPEMGPTGRVVNGKLKEVTLCKKNFFRKEMPKKIIIVVGGRGARESVCITFLFSKFSTSVFYFYNQKVKYCKEEETERCWAGTQPGRAAAPPRPRPSRQLACPGKLG